MFQRVLYKKHKLGTDKCAFLLNMYNQIFLKYKIL